MKQIISLFSVLFFCLYLYACSEDGLDTNKDDSINDSSTLYMAIFGDIQYYTNPTYIGLYRHSLDWIQAKADKGWHFNCILHTGDITMNNSITQWNSFSKATSPIAKRIPYISMIGDHDYTWEDGAYIENRNSTFINNYLVFPLTTQKIVAWFEEEKMENIVVENTVFGQRLDFLILEFGPRKEVVEWADEYVKSHEDHRFILMNHEYLEKGGGLRTSNLKCASRFRGCSFTTPEQLWNSLVKCNDNIRVVLCGHVGGLYAVTEEINDYGRNVSQIQHNIQDPAYRYDNWLMLWEFNADSDSVNVSVINTKTEQYYNDKSVLFKFKY